MEYEIVTHTFAPVWDRQSRVLILGTMPSVASRANQFYYGHPQNRFWRVMAGVLGCEVPTEIEQKRQMLLRYHIALWDVIARCEICGSSDSSIRHVVPNDIAGLVQKAPVSCIYANGGKAAALYRRYCQAAAGREIIGLPSTSPANARMDLYALTQAWSVIRDDQMLCRSIAETREHQTDKEVNPLCNFPK